MSDDHSDESGQGEQAASPALTDEQAAQLIEAARRVRANAYAPYSGYFVGAALLAADGKIHTGVNVENAAYSPTICAERSALVRAISDGVRDFWAVAVVTKDGGSPCGVCRQVLYEFAPNLIVLMADETGRLCGQYRLADLLPGAFGPANLR